MTQLPLPLQFVIATVASWLCRYECEVVAYLKQENRILRDKLRGKSIRFTDGERRRLARAAKTLSRKTLLELDTLVTPDTLLRWYRKLVVDKYDGSHKRGPGRPGRPRKREEIADLVIRMATENPTWGCTRIHSALRYVGHEIGRSTVARILAEHGMDPAPERGTNKLSCGPLAAMLHALGSAEVIARERGGGRGRARQLQRSVRRRGSLFAGVVGVGGSPPRQRRWRARTAGGTA